MTWTAIFNLRATTPFASDGAGESAILGSEGYPHTFGNGAVSGFTTDVSAQARDRNAALDRRLAGLIFHANDGTQAILPVQLPSAGDYQIRLALGDDTIGHTEQYVQIRDNTSPLLTIHDAAGTATSEWIDATGAKYSAAAWPGSNSLVTLTFTGTLLNLALAPPAAAGGDVTCLAHLFINQVASGSIPGDEGGYMPMAAPALGPNLLYY